MTIHLLKLPCCNRNALRVYTHLLPSVCPTTYFDWSTQTWIDGENMASFIVIFIAFGALCIVMLLPQTVGPGGCVTRPGYADSAVALSLSLYPSICLSLFVSLSLSLSISWFVELGGLQPHFFSSLAAICTTVSSCPPRSCFFTSHSRPFCLY